MYSSTADNSRAFRSSCGVEHEANDDARLAFRTIRDLSDLQELRTFWDRCPGTLESDFDYFTNTVQARKDCRPHVVVLLENGKPDALLVGTRESKKMPILLGCVTVIDLQVNVLEFVRGGLRGNASGRNCTALVHEVMRSLREGAADFAAWNQLDVQSALYKSAMRSPPFVLRDHSHCSVEHWFMKFPKGPEVLGMRRKLVRRWCRKLVNRFRGKLLIRCFRSPADLEVAVSDVEEIASKTEKRLLGVGFFDNVETRKQMFAAAERDWLRVYILYIAGKPAAFWTGTLYDRCLQADHVGFDPIWSKFSPGIFLFLGIIEDLCNAEVETLDLRWGNSPWYQRFGALRQVEAQVHVYAPTLRGLQLNLLSTIANRGNGLIRRIRWLEGARKAVRQYFVQRRRNHLSITTWRPEFEVTPNFEVTRPN